MEPTALVRSGDELLLAGAPSYLWRREPNGTATLMARDSAFGAVIDRAGRARLVPFPFASRTISDVRAVARRGGGWTVTFAELPANESRSSARAISRLWSAVFDGRSWSAIGELPVPPDLQLRPLAASSLVHADGVLLWAFPFDRAEGGSGASLYAKDGSAWTQQTIPLYGSAYVEVGVSDSLGTILLAVHPDSTLPVSGNSLFLYARQPRWRQVRKVASGGREPIHFPSLSLDPSGGALTWLAIVSDRKRFGYEARTMVGRPDLHNERVIALDTATLGVELLRLGSRRIWIIDRASEGEDDDDGMRAVSDSAATAITLAVWRSPFARDFAVEATGADEVLFAGTLQGEPPRDPVIATMLVRARLECRVSAH